MDKKYAVIIDSSGEIKTLEVEPTENYEWFDNIERQLDMERVGSLSFPLDHNYDCYYDDDSMEKDLPVNQKATNLFNLGNPIYGSIIILHFNGTDDSELMSAEQLETLLKYLA